MIGIDLDGGAMNIMSLLLLQLLMIELLVRRC